MKKLLLVFTASLHHNLQFSMFISHLLFFDQIPGFENGQGHRF